MGLRSSFIALLALACLHATIAFRPLPRIMQRAVARSPKVASRARATDVRMMSKQYWEGEWVCADCGYIYQADDFDNTPFEEQGRGFKCPQCSAPRRRFAKKVGDKVAVTLDGGDAPILLFSLVGGVGVIAFGIYAALNF